MDETTIITVNGKQHRVQATPDTPLLYVLRNELNLRGPKFGCGLAQCGVCSVLLDRAEIRSCVTPVAAAAGHAITTLEGLPALWAADTGQSLQQDGHLHPVQQAWIDEQVPQCGYCQSGMMMQAVSLLHSHPNPSTQKIREEMDGHICRCGAHIRIVKAIQRASTDMRKAG